MVLNLDATCWPDVTHNGSIFPDDSLDMAPSAAAGLMTSGMRVSEGNRHGGGMHSASRGHLHDDGFLWNFSLLLCDYKENRMERMGLEKMWELK